MKYWGGQTPPAWIREIAEERPRPLVIADDQSHVQPKPGDIVLKPFIDDRTYRQLFRIETWKSVREAMACAFEFGVTSRLEVWLDYSDHPNAHDLDAVPLYDSDTTTSSEWVA
jgi:hypothetical protein